MQNDWSAYKLTITFYSPMVYFTPPAFDGVLSYALQKKYHEGRGMIIAARPKEVKTIGLDKLPEYIMQFDDFYLTTQMQPIGEVIEYLDSWKKRFESKYAQLIDFGKAKRQINVASGTFRSYNMPLAGKVVNSAYWEFIGDGEKVLDIIENYLWAVGKKTSQGFGVIKSIALEKINAVAIDILNKRPIPLSIAKQFNIKGQKRLCAYKPPYWLSEPTECVCPHV